MVDVVAGPTKPYLRLNEVFQSPGRPVDPFLAAALSLPPRRHEAFLDQRRSRAYAY
jgi:hypothetical protein